MTSIGVDHACNIRNKDESAQNKTKLGYHFSLRLCLIAQNLETCSFYISALGILALAEKKGFDEFVTLVEKAGLKKELNTAENLTVFVPSNEAIQVL